MLEGNPYRARVREEADDPGTAERGIDARRVPTVGIPQKPLEKSFDRGINHVRLSGFEGVLLAGLQRGDV